MQTKHLCVLIHIRTKGGVVTVKLHVVKSPPVFLLLTVPRRCFFCRSFLFIAFVFEFCDACLKFPCGHLLGKG